jgi:hypothetical protein
MKQGFPSEANGLLFRHEIGSAVAQAVSRWLSIAAPRFRFRAEHVGFVVDKAALGQVFSE